MKYNRTKFTPGFLSISFGVFLLLLSGASGFYLSKEAPETVSSVQPVAATPAPTEVSSPSPIPQESPTAAPTRSVEDGATGTEGTPKPTATPSPTPSPIPSPTPKATATPSTTIYIVKDGDTLLDIADKYGVSVDALLKANGLSDPDKLSVGDKLTIPRE